MGPLAVAVQEIKTLLTFLRYPSFILMICQGIFGSIPWIVIGNLTLYARLCGFELWTLFWLSAPGLFGVVGVRLPGQEDWCAWPPSDSHADSCQRCSIAVHHVVWDCPWFSSQQCVGFLCDSSALP